MTELADLHVLCTLWTLNGERSMHFHKRNELVGEARLAAKNAARDAHVAPIVGAVRIEAEPLQCAGTLADPGNHYPVIKAIVDGLVDAGVLSNDTLREVLAIDQLPPRKVKRADLGVRVRILAR